MFLYLSVILFTGVGGGGGDCPVHAGIHTPQEQTAPRSKQSWSTHPLEQTPPKSRHPPREDTPPGEDTPLLGADTPIGADTPPAQWMLGDTGNKRAVRILLECILVYWLLFLSELLRKIFIAITADEH